MLVAGAGEDAVFASEARALGLDEIAPADARAMVPLLSHALARAAHADHAWDIDTDRGATRLVLKGEEDIRRLTATVLIVSDTHGVQYLIRDPLEMDAHSRRLLDRFM
jgi:hypothetical protein